MRSGFRWVLAVVLATCIAAESHALEPATPLARMGRQSWTMENGLPQNTVPVLLQSRSGYLWAGTELGLARFDGIGFRLFDHTTPSFPDAEVRCLLDAKDGALWIGTSDGLVRWNDNRATLITSQNGLPGNSIRGLAQTSDGTVWAWTELGLARWDGETFQPATPAPAGAITSIAADGAGALWVGTTAGALLLRRSQWRPDPAAAKTSINGKQNLPSRSLVTAVSGGDVLIATADGVFLDHQGAITSALAKAVMPQDGVSYLARLAGGAIAAASKSTLVLAQPADSKGQAVSRFSVQRQLPGSRIESLFADREGCLWAGSNHGMARICPGHDPSSPFAVEWMPPTDPLAANAVVSILEDREGDLWLGTETGGLHILRDARFRIVGSADGLSSDATTAIVQDAQDTLWIGTRDSGLNRIAGSRTTSLTTKNGLLSDVILALATAPNGDLWVGTPDGLNRIAKGVVTSFTSADGLPDDFIRSLLVAPDGSIWIGTRRGLTHLDRGRFQTFTQTGGLGSDLVGALTRTGDGDLWIATLDGLSRLHQGKLHNFTTADGLSSNVITALDVTADGMIWIGTQGDGLNLWDGKRFVAIRTSPEAQGPGQNPGRYGQIPAAVHAVLHDDLGHLWLASDTGLTRIDLQSLLACAHSSAQPCRLGAHLVNFSTADGLRSRETSSNSHPTAMRGADGQLWFTTPRGVIVVDPLHFADPPGPPPVAMERFSVDDRDQEAGSQILAGHLRFQFDYAGLSFASPQKLRYEYMLEGFDHAWTAAGARRTAYYTNIPPGAYTFRVRAALGDAPFPAGGANSAPADGSSEAALTFELLPHFYQTVWFRALLGLLGVALVVLIFRRRVLRVEREFRAVMAERNRIAREIHDTLAQGYVGISLQLEILGELLRHNRPDSAAKHLTVTQGLVRDGLKDARQSIWALRSQDAGEQTLPIRLRRLVEQAQGGNLAAMLDVHGTYRALAPDVEQEILRIAQEAIHNVKRHAAASLMSVHLDYDERGLVLAVVDDGQGFDVSNLREASKAGVKANEGHYGLTGMQERAALIHGEIEILSNPGQGTTVRLTVEAPESSASAPATPDLPASTGKSF